MSVPSSAILTVAAIVAGVSVSTMAVMAVRSPLNHGQQNSVKAASMEAQMAEMDISEYDGTVVSGTRVIAAVKQFAGEDISIGIVNAKGILTEFGWQYNGEDTRMTNIEEKRSESMRDIQNKSSSNYVSPSAKYNAYVVRDVSTGAPMQILFILQINADTMGNSSDPGTAVIKTGGGSGNTSGSMISGYIITLDQNDGSNQKTRYHVMPGDTVTLTKPSDRKGYNFLGWFTEKSGGTHKENFSADHSMTLYAHWQQKAEYAFLYHGNGGTVSMDSETFDYTSATSYKMSGKAEREGYDFLGWSETENGSVKFKPGDTIKKEAFGTKKIKNLYAAWKIKTYEDTMQQKIYADPAGTKTLFFGSDSSGYADTRTIKVQYNADILLKTPADSFTMPNGFTRKNTVRYNRIPVPLEKTIKQEAKSMLFEAEYVPVQYSISYVLNGGEVKGPANPTHYTVLNGVSLTDPVKNGYDFIGWKDQKGHMVSGINAGQACAFNNASDFFAETGKRTTGDQVLTAQWNPKGNIPYKVIEQLEQEDGTFKTVKTKNLTGITDQIVKPIPDEFSSYKTPDAQSITVTSDGKAYVIYQYYKIWSITYNLDYGKNAAGTKNTYLSTDMTYTLPEPYKNGWAFDGWTGSNGNMSQETVTIAHNSRGNKVYTAHWIGETVGVQCEDWTVDYNGKPYRKLGTEDQIHFVKIGTTISGADWGNSQAANKYRQWYTYQPQFQESVKVTKNTKVVYRYFYLNNNDDIRISSVDRVGNGIPMTADIKTVWKDRNGKVITENTYPHITVYGTFCAAPGVNNSNKSWPEGIRYGWPDGGLSSYINEVSQAGYKVASKTAHYVYWDRYPATCGTSSYSYITYWDDTRNMFVGSGPIWQGDSRVKNKYADGVVKHFRIKQPDGTVIIKDWAVNGTYPTHSEVTMFFTVNGIETKETDIKPKAKPGWMIWDNDYPWYCGSKGEQSLYYKLNTGRSYFMDGNIHVDGCSIQQDAYGIKFDNNSGSGTMRNQMISNIASENNRKLSKCTFTHENYRFIGWAKNPNAEKPDFKDEAVVPTHMTGINKMITLYAVWEKNK